MKDHIYKKINVGDSQNIVDSLSVSIVVLG